LKLLSAVLIAGSMLAGCATTPPGLPAPRDQVRDFTLDARFALRVSLPERPAESSGGRLAWEHKNGNDRILVSNPLGIGLAEIETSPERARLHTADGQTRESSDADALMEEVTGQPLPVRQLPNWLLGRAQRPGNIESDGQGRPLRLAEAGWQIDYAYADDAPDALPSSVTLRRASEVELRLRIEEWKTAP
jgi:outer membrane lipoprotein LolB